jgi:hypothetical protein
MIAIPDSLFRNADSIVFMRINPCFYSSEKAEIIGIIIFADNI